MKTEITWKWNIQAKMSWGNNHQNQAIFFKNRIEVMKIHMVFLLDANVMLYVLFPGKFVFYTCHQAKIQ